MFIEIRQPYDGFCILHCEGAFVPGPDMQYMEARLDDVRKLAYTRLLVDFQSVTAIGSVGVTFILAAWRSVAQRPGGRFMLTGVIPRVRLVLDLTGISTAVPLAADLATGLAILGGEDAAASPALSHCISADH